MSRLAHALHRRAIRLCNRLAFPRRARLDRDQLRAASRIPIEITQETFRVGLPQGPAPLPLEANTVAAFSKPQSLTLYSPALLANVEILKGTLVVAEDGRIVDESGMGNTEYLEKSQTSPLVVCRKLLPIEAEIEQALPLVSAMSRYYYHWVAESLCRVDDLVRHRQALGIAGRFACVIDGPEWRFQTQSLTYLFGIAPDDMIPRARLGRRARIGACYMPFYNKEYSPRTDMVEMHAPSALRGLNERAWSLGQPSRRDRLILIHRPDHLPRSLANADQLLRAIPGLEAHVLEDLPFADQVELIKSASLIIAPHGAGLANLVFARDAMVVELYPSVSDASDSRDFIQICSALGLRHHLLRCASVAPNIRMTLDLDTIGLISGLVEDWLEETRADRPARGQPDADRGKTRKSRAEQPISGSE